MPEPGICWTKWIWWNKTGSFPEKNRTGCFGKGRGTLFSFRGSLESPRKVGGKTDFSPVNYASLPLYFTCKKSIFPPLFGVIRDPFAFESGGGGRIQKGRVILHHPPFPLP